MLNPILNPKIKPNIEPKYITQYSTQYATQYCTQYFTQYFTKIFHSIPKNFFAPPQIYIQQPYMSQWPFVKTLQPLYDKAYPSLTHLEWTKELC